MCARALPTYCIVSTLLFCACVRECLCRVERRFFVGKVHLCGPGVACACLSVEHCGLASLSRACVLTTGVERVHPVPCHCSELSPGGVKLAGVQLGAGLEVGGRALRCGGSTERGSLASVQHGGLRFVPEGKNGPPRCLLMVLLLLQL